MQSNTFSRDFGRHSDASSKFRKVAQLLQKNWPDEQKKTAV
jgi:hypothetical protein